jgi:hypothetical protein
MLPSPGTFTWTNGILNLTDQDVTFDSALAPIPLPSSTTLQNEQTLILSGPSRDLVVGRSGAGQLDLLNRSSVHINDGEVLIAEQSGSVGMLQLLSPDSYFVVDGSMGVGGSTTQAGGTGTLTIAGGLEVSGTLKCWPTATVTVVDSTSTITANVIDGCNGLTFNSNGYSGFNELKGFGNAINFGGVSAVGVAEGDAKAGTSETTGNRIRFKTVGSSETTRQHKSN